MPSTTQTSVFSRVGSSQIAQRSASDTMWQSTQKRTRVTSSTRAPEGRARSSRAATG